MLPKRTVLTGLVVLAVAVPGFGYAAANTVPSGGAGDGSATVLGYAFSGSQTYVLDTDNPQKLSQVTFTLSPAPPAAATLRVKVGSASTTWYSCAATGLATLTCTFPIATAPSSLTADQLRVVVVN